MRKHFIGFLLVTAAVITSSAAIAETDQKPVIGSGQIRTIRIAVMKDLQPFCFQDEYRKNQGVVIDMWKLWSEKTGIRIEFIPGTTKEVIDMVRNGNAEAAAGIVHSQDRDSYLDFTPSPISALSSTFFFHKTILGLQTLHDLAGFKIGIIKGRYAEEFVRKNLPQATLASYPSLSDMTDAAEKGEIRVFIVPIENMRWMLKKRGILSEFQFNATHPLFTENLYPAVAEGNSELAEIIEQGMLRITAEERAAIERKWLIGVRTEDTLILAMGNDFPPLFFVSQQGEPAGLFVDIWRLWSQKTGQKIEFRPEIYTDAIEHIRTGKTDMHVGLLKSRDREAWMDFFNPLYEPNISIFFHVHDRRCSNITELSGHPVGVLENSVAEQILTEKYPNIAIVPYESIRKMILAARDGEIHAFAAVSVVANEILSRLGLSGEFESRGEPISQVSYCPGIRKGNPELYSLIQNGFDAISYQEMAEIESRWIQNPVKHYFSSKIPTIKLTDREKAWIRQHPVINFGISTGYAPFTFVGKDGKPDGMVMDYIGVLRKKTGMEFRVEVAKPWIDLIPLIRGNAIDGVAFASRTEEREKYLLFTDNYVENPWVIVTRNDFQGIDLKPTDLDGKKVAVLKTSPVEELLRRYPNIILVSLPTVEHIWEAVSMGEADAACSSLASASYYISRKGITNLKVAGVVEYRQRFGSGIRKDFPELVAILNKAIASITPEEHQAIEKKWISLRYETVFDWRIFYRWLLPIGSISGVIVILTLVWNRRLAKEIEKRKQIEVELRRARHEWENIFQAIGSPAVILDTEHNIITANRAVVAAFGMSEQDISGRKCYEIFHGKASVAPADGCPMEKILLSSNVETVEMEMEAFDGVFLVSCTPVFDEQGRLEKIIHIATDITERKRAEEEIRKEKILSESMINSLPGVFYFFDDQGKFLRWNKNFEDYTGYSADEFARITPLDLFTDSEKELVAQRIQTVFREGKSEVEAHLTAKDGKQRLYFLTGCRVILNNKHFLIGVGHDISERRQAEQAIRKLNEELEERVRSRTAQLEAANKELKSFSYSVSHDLRAPLRSIDGWSLALAEDCADQLDETGKKYLSRIREETLRMGNLIEDMLRLSRMSRCEMRITQIDLSEMAENIAARLRESVSRFAEFRIQPNLTAAADAGMMEILLTNLLGNAWKFTGKIPEAKIEFGILGYDDSGRQIFYVRDNGAGFDMAYSAKLFGAFQRLHKANEFPGTGIGLAIVQRIIHRHGGRVWTEAAVNQGATFYFTVREAV